VPIDQSAATPDGGLPQELAELVETSGWPGLAGRVIGELMLADPPYLSTTQLCERCGASKGHLSTTLKLLTTSGLVERFGVPGSRLDHYRMAPDAFVRSIQRSIEPLSRLAEQADRALASLPPGSLAASQVTRMRDIYRFLADRVPELITEFETSNTTRRPKDR
jgi:DNA-binding transcriptional regulator GbsR (MarR family)